MSNKPVVSVFCLTYNHAPYIRKALDGIMAQKTDFPIEIVIHDDASTDGTADIIREYESKYPNVIKPVYQTENQYGKENVLERCAFPLIRGKYTAICEGDDYWISDRKLQKQVSYMEQHPYCSMTFHAANYEVDGVVVCNDRRSDTEMDFSVSDIVLGRGTFCATASLCCRTEYFKIKPPFKPTAMMIGDYPLQIWMALNGMVHYFPEIMSAYNATHPGSWTSENEDGKALDRKTLFDLLEMLKRLDACTNQKYTRQIRGLMAKYIDYLFFNNNCPLSELVEWIQEVPLTRWGKYLQL